MFVTTIQCNSSNFTYILIFYNIIYNSMYIMIYCNNLQYNNDFCIMLNQLYNWIRKYKVYSVKMIKINIKSTN